MGRPVGWRWRLPCTDKIVHALVTSFLFTIWGVCIIAALDSLPIFFLPFAVDLGVVFLSARNPEFFWGYTILMSAMSLIGAGVTFYIGYRIGEAELERFLSSQKAKKTIDRVRKKGAIALAALDLIPPPFPFSAFILTAGALEVSAVRFFIAMFGFRLIRFGVEAALAAKFGPGVIRLIESHTAHVIAAIFTFIIIAGSIVTIYMFVRKVRQPKPQQRRAA